MSKNDSSDRSLSWLGRLRRHPIFPLLLLIPITQIVRDHYPISHYPMYSRPNYEESVFFFVGDTDQKPVPVKLESGISVSQVGKKYRFHKLELIQKEEKKGRLFGQLTPEDISEIESTAGIKSPREREPAGRAAALRTLVIAPNAKERSSKPRNVPPATRSREKSCKPG